MGIAASQGGSRVRGSPGRDRLARSSGGRGRSRRATVRSGLAALPPLLKLAAGDRDGYAKACRDLLAKHGGADGSAAAWVAWACVVAPAAVDDPQAVVRLAEKATGRLAATVKAAAQLRAGRVEA